MIALPCWGSLLCLCLLPWPAHGPTELRWKFTPKSAFTLETVSTLQQVVKTGAQETKQDVTYKARTRYTVEKATPAETVLEMRVEGFEATRADKKPVPTAVRPELKDATLRLKLDAQQQVIGVEGYQEFLSRATGDDPNLLKSLQAILSEESLRQVAQQAFAYLPGKPVQPGDRWEKKLTVPLGPLGAFQVTNSYVLEQPEKRGSRLCQRIAVTSQVKYEPPQNLNLPFVIKGGEFQVTEGKGMIWFDAQAGELVNSELKLSLQGKLTIETQGKVSVIDLRQEQKVEVRQIITEE
jgi:hypothetical protein